MTTHINTGTSTGLRWLRRLLLCVVLALVTSAAGAVAGKPGTNAWNAVADAAPSTTGGTVRVVVLDQSGRALLSGPGAGQRVYTASLVKLLVVEQLFHRAEDGDLNLDAADLSLMRRAVETSDDSAMSSLWTRFDGPQLVTDAADEFDLSDTASTRIPGEWGASTTTAADYASFLAGLRSHLHRTDYRTLARWMHATTSRAADGFDQDFGTLAPDLQPAGTVRAKQGWMCCTGHQRELHSAGVLADGRVVVALGAFPVGTTWGQAISAVDAAVSAAVRRTD
jgi:hypothetical protein